MFGSLDGPGGAPAALTVAAIDPRRATASVHLSVWHGLDVTFDARLPLLGTIVPPEALDLAIGVPHGDGEQVSDYFDRRGLGIVAGRAALVHAGPDPGAAAVAASEGGARAVLVYGGNLPAGSLGLSSDVGVPVVAIPAAAAHAILAGLRDGAAGRRRTWSCAQRAKPARGTHRLVLVAWARVRWCAQARPCCARDRARDLRPGRRARR